MGKESTLDVGDVAKGKSDDIRFRENSNIRIATYKNSKYILARLNFQENTATLYGKVVLFELVDSKKSIKNKSEKVWYIQYGIPSFMVKLKEIAWEDAIINEELLNMLKQ